MRPNLRPSSTSWGLRARPWRWSAVILVTFTTKCQGNFSWAFCLHFIYLLDVNQNNIIYSISNQFITKEWQLIMNYSYDRESEIYNRNLYYTSYKYKYLKLLKLLLCKIQCCFFHTVLFLCKVSRCSRNDRRPGRSLPPCLRSSGRSRSLVSGREEAHSAGRQALRCKFELIFAEQIWS